MKIIALAALTSVALATPATAGVYVNVEANGSRTGSNVESTTTDLHVGYEGGNDSFTYYIQGGPAIVAVDGVDSDNRISGKVGASFAATEKLGVYGEVSLLTADEDTNDDNSWGTKIGAKYSF
jgi:outer membrane autotransporter protein